MDYKEKYNRLVGAVKVLQETNPSDEGIRNWVNDNVPELRESEDEKIRIALINVFATHKDYEMFFGVSVEDIQAWLERQGEHAVACSEEQMKVLNEVLNFADWWNSHYSSKAYTFEGYTGHYLENSTVIEIAKYFYKLGLTQKGE